MKTSTAIGYTFGVIVLAIALLFLEAALLGLILSWFNVSLTIWQNFAIVFLANLIINPSSGGSSK
jgi:VIT1/CCC1 family predicted Fe2+/Mn2+ transporter